MLVASDLSKRFGGFLAVNRVSFEVREGEIVGLIGPNGSGKSTTFNLIAGTLRPTAGAIRFRDKTLPACRRTRSAIEGLRARSKSRVRFASCRSSTT